MVERQYLGKKYKLVASTDKRVGSVLLAIRKIDTNLLKNKRPRIKNKFVSKEQKDYDSFEKGLIEQIKNFKKHKNNE